MKEWPFSYKVQFISGICILLCIPMVLLAEIYGFAQVPLYLTLFIAILLCFLSGGIVLCKARKRLHETHRYLSGFGFVLSFVYLLFIGFFIFSPVFSDLWHSRKFDSQVWKQSADEQSGWPPRLCMVDNLMKSHTLDGLTKEEVIELLGEPHKKDFPFEAVYCDVHYYLGPGRSLIRFDSEWLFITFDDNDRVNRYWIYRN